MIRVESDVSGKWGADCDWPALAQRSAEAAVLHSRFAPLADAGLEVEVSVKFTSDAELKALNAAYRNRDAATNVLSFPMIEAGLLEPLESADGGEILLGDVVLARGVCAAEAAERRIEVATHASHLVVHGVLHLLGYDHERDESEAEAMEAIEREALASLGIPDPYAVREVQG